MKVREPVKKKNVENSTFVGGGARPNVEFSTFFFWRVP